MQITNRTKWSTDDLRAIISAALKLRGVPSTGLVVEIVPSRRRGQWKVTEEGSVWESAVRDSITGVAYLGKMREHITPAWRNGGVEKREKRMRYGKWMRLRLPNPERVTRGYALVRQHFAQVVEHEVAHLQGLRHGDMSDALRWCTQETPWLGELPLGEEVYPDEAKEIAAAQSGRLEHARSMLGKAVTREKRASTLRKKWERRVRALERVGGES
jgi:hypothetical protein